jgi:hypothetical protein
MIKMRIVMKAIYLSIMFCFAWSLISTNIAHAQDEPIKVKFEIDGEEIHKPFKILLSARGSAIFEPPITDGSFIFPPELRSYEKVNLRLLYKEYDLDYGDVYLSKFNGELIFGVDKKPFDGERVRSNPYPDKELMLIYYLESGSTIQTTFIYK